MMKKEKKITRKQAIKKVGLTALTTSTLFILESKARSGTSAGRIADSDDK